MTRTLSLLLSCIGALALHAYEQPVHKLITLQSISRNP